MCSIYRKILLSRFDSLSGIFIFLKFMECRVWKTYLASAEILRMSSRLRTSRVMLISARTHFPFAHAHIVTREIFTCNKFIRTLSIWLKKVVHESIIIAHSVVFLLSLFFYNVLCLIAFRLHVTLLGHLCCKGLWCTFYL